MKNVNFQDGSKKFKKIEDEEMKERRRREELLEEKKRLLLAMFTDHDELTRETQKHNARVHQRHESIGGNSGTNNSGGNSNLTQVLGQSSSTPMLSNNPHASSQQTTTYLSQSEQQFKAEINKFIDFNNKQQQKLETLQASLIALTNNPRQKDSASSLLSSSHMQSDFFFNTNSAFNSIQHTNKSKHNQQQYQQQQQSVQSQQFSRIFSKTYFKGERVEALGSKELFDVPEIEALIERCKANIATSDENLLYEQERTTVLQHQLSELQKSNLLTKKKVGDLQQLSSAATHRFTDIKRIKHLAQQKQRIQLMQLTSIKTALESQENMRNSMLLRQEEQRDKERQQCQQEEESTGLLMIRIDEAKALDAKILIELKDVLEKEERILSKRMESNDVIKYIEFFELFHEIFLQDPQKVNMEKIKQLMPAVTQSENGHEGGGGDSGDGMLIIDRTHPTMHSAMAIQMPSHHHHHNNNQHHSSSLHRQQQQLHQTGEFKSSSMQSISKPSHLQTTILNEEDMQGSVEVERSTLLRMINHVNEKFKEQLSSQGIENILTILDDLRYDQETNNEMYESLLKAKTNSTQQLLNLSESLSELQRNNEYVLAMESNAEESEKYEAIQEAFDAGILRVAMPKYAPTLTGAGEEVAKRISQYTTVNILKHVEDPDFSSQMKSISEHKNFFFNFFMSFGDSILRICRTIKTIYKTILQNPPSSGMTKKCAETIAYIKSLWGEQRDAAIAAEAAADAIASAAAAATTATGVLPPHNLNHSAIHSSKSPSGHNQQEDQAQTATNVNPASTSHHGSISLSTNLLAINSVNSNNNNNYNNNSKQSTQRSRNSLESLFEDDTFSAQDPSQLNSNNNNNPRKSRFSKRQQKHVLQSKFSIESIQELFACIFSVESSHETLPAQKRKHKESIDNLSAGSSQAISLNINNAPASSTNVHSQRHIHDTNALIQQYGSEFFQLLKNDRGVWFFCSFEAIKSYVFKQQEHAATTTKENHGKNRLLAGLRGCVSNFVDLETIALQQCTMKLHEMRRLFIEMIDQMRTENSEIKATLSETQLANLENNAFHFQPYNHSYFAPNSSQNLSLPSQPFARQLLPLSDSNQLSVGADEEISAVPALKQQQSQQQQQQSHISPKIASAIENAIKRQNEYLYSTTTDKEEQALLAAQQTQGNAGIIINNNTNTTISVTSGIKPFNSSDISTGNSAGNLNAGTLSISGAGNIIGTNNMNNNMMNSVNNPNSTSVNNLSNGAGIHLGSSSNNALKRSHSATYIEIVNYINSVPTDKPKHQAITLTTYNNSNNNNNKLDNQQQQQMFQLDDKKSKKQSQRQQQNNNKTNNKKQKQQIPRNQTTTFNLPPMILQHQQSQQQILSSNGLQQSSGNSNNQGGGASNMIQLSSQIAISAAAAAATNSGQSEENNKSANNNTGAASNGGATAGILKKRTNANTLVGLPQTSSTKGRNMLDYKSIYDIHEDLFIDEEARKQKSREKQLLFELQLREKATKDLENAEANSKTRSKAMKTLNNQLFALNNGGDTSGNNNNAATSSQTSSHLYSNPLSSHNALSAPNTLREFSVNSKILSKIDYLSRIGTSSSSTRNNTINHNSINNNNNSISEQQKLLKEEQNHLFQQMVKQAQLYDMYDAADSVDQIDEVTGLKRSTSKSKPLFTPTNSYMKSTSSQDQRKKAALITIRELQLARSKSSILAYTANKTEGNPSGHSIMIGTTTPANIGEKYVPPQGHSGGMQSYHLPNAFIMGGSTAPSSANHRFYSSAIGANNSTMESRDSGENRNLTMTAGSLQSNQQQQSTLLSAKKLNRFATRKLQSSSDVGQRQQQQRQLQQQQQQHHPSQPSALHYNPKYSMQSKPNFVDFPFFTSPNMTSPAAGAAVGSSSGGSLSGTNPAAIYSLLNPTPYMPMYTPTGLLMNTQNKQLTTLDPIGHYNI